MMKSFSFAGWVLIGSVLVGGATGCTGPVPLVRAHAHNDYEHRHPLTDALKHGFCSVEADVHLVDGQLLVGHDAEDLRPNRTLESLYLAPLRKRIRKNGGRVYKNGPQLTLLIDIKTDAEATYRALHDLLAAYGDMVSSFDAGGRHEKAVLVVISGNRPRELMMSQPLRYAGYDGRLSDLQSQAPADFMPLISDRWPSYFTWMGEGEMPDGEREELSRIVDRCHVFGRRLRFWATPENERVWEVLYDAGVDLINADDLARLQAFLLAKRGLAGE